MVDRIEKPESEWKQTLSENVFQVCRARGTEPPFSGDYYDCKTEGTYVCACCELPLFRSEKKYNSGSGWPSFWAPVDKEHIIEIRDTSHGMIRTEVTCARCDAHLGHVFPDGPPPSGLRFCINSLSMKLEEDES